MTKYRTEFVRNASERKPFVSKIYHSGHRSMVEIFNWKDDADRQNTFLHQIAAMKDAHDALDLLMKIPDLDINAVNRDGDTAAHIALRLGHIYVLDRFTKNKSFDATIVDKNSDSVLHLAELLNYNHFKEAEADHFSNQIQISGSLSYSC